EPAAQPGLPGADEQLVADPAHVGVAALRQRSAQRRVVEQSPEALLVLGRHRLAPPAAARRVRVRLPVRPLAAGEGRERLVETEIGGVGEHARIVAQNSRGARGFGSRHRLISVSSFETLPPRGRPSSQDASTEAGREPPVAALRPWEDRGRGTPPRFPQDGFRGFYAPKPPPPSV